MSQYENRIVTVQGPEIEIRAVSNAQLGNAALRVVELRGCRAIGLRLTAELAADLYMQDTQLDYAVITLEKVKGIAGFTDCSFREATLVGDLSAVVFDNCDFTGAEFQASRAASCDLRTSNLDCARGLASLRGAIISPSQTASIAVRLATEVGLTVKP